MPTRIDASWPCSPSCRTRLEEVTAWLRGHLMVHTMGAAVLVAAQQHCDEHRRKHDCVHDDHQRPGTFHEAAAEEGERAECRKNHRRAHLDRKSTRLNSSH